MKIVAAWLPLVLLATPVAASIQLGPSEWPEKKYSSPRACERALFALIKAEMAKPQSPDRQATVSDDHFTIRTYVDSGSSYRAHRCRGAYLTDTRGSVASSPLPPPPKP